MVRLAAESSSAPAEAMVAVEQLQDVSKAAGEQTVGASANARPRLGAKAKPSKAGVLQGRSCTFVDTELAPTTKENEAADSAPPQASQLPPLPIMRDDVGQGGSKFVGVGGTPAEESSPPGKTEKPGEFLSRLGPPLPLVRELLVRIFHDNDGNNVLHGDKAPQHQAMSVADIHFTQNSVSSRFGHGHLQGRLLTDVAGDLQAGRLNASDIPLVAVKFSSRYWSLNNRSLYALRLASQAGRPQVAQVAAFESLCPATAKFIQLRCGFKARAEALQKECVLIETQSNKPK
eukprot:TRINITY_DN26291_c0_g1_i1.p1 TRINITY_DN26291_c0_g1~~TRINITY_DN26291_c0_g1_i1.p1  ORF type:complete len:289 (+),score=33.09 TRINITY_DN26291_c0_g1_i1:87-953(+)